MQEKGKRNVCKEPTRSIVSIRQLKVLCLGNNGLSGYTG